MNFSSNRVTSAYGSTTKIVRVDVYLKTEAPGCPRSGYSGSAHNLGGKPFTIHRAIETALRFGKGKVNIISLSENAQRPTPDAQRRTNHQLPFSTGWHCAHCDLDIRPPTPGLFSFNNPLGACPKCQGFRSLPIAIDLNKAIPNRGLSIKQGVVRVFRGAEFGESQKDLLRACAQEEIDIDVPFEELPKADQDFVIEGEKRSGDYTEEDYDNDRWYGVRGFFRWLERLDKMRCAFCLAAIGLTSPARAAMADDTSTKR